MQIFKSGFLFRIQGNVIDGCCKAAGFGERGDAMH